MKSNISGEGDEMIHTFSDGVAWSGPNTGRGRFVVKKNTEMPDPRSHIPPSVDR
jgi:hypothetical protein